MDGAGGGGGAEEVSEDKIDVWKRKDSSFGGGGE